MYTQYKRYRSNKGVYCVISSDFYLLFALSDFSDLFCRVSAVSAVSAMFLPWF